jgi:hypothetical protein
VVKKLGVENFRPLFPKEGENEIKIKKLFPKGGELK